MVSLKKEIAKQSDAKSKINTIYFGGGTPSLIPAKEIYTLLETIGSLFPLSQDIEITLEANPGTIDLDYLRELKKTGVNRLSIGVQSFNDDKLKFLGRIHSAGQAKLSIENAGKAGFDHISTDLIYGIPFETKKLWLEDLKEAVKAAPSHMSCYMLTIEDGTILDEKLKKGLFVAHGAGTMSDLFKTTSRFLNDNGYDHYEISSFARGFKNRSRHNSKYWDMVPYYGFGAAAHSYDGKTRSWNYPDIDTYIKTLDSGRLPVHDQEILTREQKMTEMVMLQLRTLDGLDMKKFQTLFKVSFQIMFDDILKQLIKDAFGKITENRFALTLKGRMHLNHIVEIFARKIL